MKTHYETLGVSIDETIPNIKKQYYRLAKRYHPDKHSGDKQKSEQFKQLSEAYSTLSNPKKRYIYDLKIAINATREWTDFLDIQFSDEEILWIHEYYVSFNSKTEIKFLKLLYRTLPITIKESIQKRIHEIMEYTGNHETTGIPESSSTSLWNMWDLKVIDCRKLYDDYTVTLQRNLSDVYHNVCKQVQIHLKSKSWIVYITHSDYTLCFPNDKASFKIQIITHVSDYHIDGCDLHKTISYNLYEHYFAPVLKVCLPDDTLLYHQRGNRKYVEHGLRNPLTNTRGSLYITEQLKLASFDTVCDHQNTIKSIFT